MSFNTKSVRSRIVIAPLLLGILSACSSVGGDESLRGDDPNEGMLESASGELTSDYSPQIQQALSSGDASLVTAADLLAAIELRLNDIVTSQRADLSAIFRLNPDGTAGPSSISGVDWNPSHDSITMTSLNMEQSTPLLLSNFSFKTTQRPTSVLGVFGQIGAGRYVALGGNPLHDMKRTTEPGGSANASMQAVLKSALAWLTKSEDLDHSPFKVVLAHLPDVHYFRHDATTRKWFIDTYPGATVNAEDACEGTALAGCLQGASLLVLGSEDGAADGENPNTNLNVDGVMSTIDGALATGTPVLYLQFDGTLTKLGQKLMSRFEVAAADNYARQDALAAWDPSTMSAQSSEITALLSLRSTLANGSLTGDDFYSCTTGPTLGGLKFPACEAAAFKSKARDGLDFLKKALQALDASATPLFSTPGREVLKLFVLLGDKYRAGDAATPAITYPVNWVADPNALARAALADSVVYYNRGLSPKQKNLGTTVGSPGTELEFAL